MSLNIPVSLLRISQDVAITIDMDQLSPTMRKRVGLMVSRGVVEGQGQVAKLAEAILHTHGLAYVHVSKWGMCSFRNLPEVHPLRQFVQEMRALSLLIHTEYSYIKQPRWQEMVDIAKDGYVPAAENALEHSKALNMGYAIPIEGVMRLTLFKEGDREP